MLICLAISQPLLALLLLFVACWVALTVSLVYGVLHLRRKVRDRDKMLREIGFDVENGVWDLERLRKASAALHELDYRQFKMQQSKKPERKSR